MDQIIIYFQCHQTISIKSYNLNESDIVENITKSEWYVLFNNYIGMEIQNKHPFKTKNRLLTKKAGKNLKVSL